MASGGHFKIMSNVLSGQENQTKTALRFHVASVIRTDIKKVIQQIIQYCIYKIIAILSQLISISAGTGMREKLLFTGENANV